MSHNIKEERGRFYVGDQESPDAELIFNTDSEGTMTITHTMVIPEMRGEGVSKGIVEYAVNYARDHGMKVVPDCPFARKVIEGTPEFHDVLGK